MQRRLFVNYQKIWSWYKIEFTSSRQMRWLLKFHQQKGASCNPSTCRLHCRSYTFYTNSSFFFILLHTFLSISPTLVSYIMKYNFFLIFFFLLKKREIVYSETIFLTFILILLYNRNEIHAVFVFPFFFSLSVSIIFSC